MLTSVAHSTILCLRSIMLKLLFHQIFSFSIKYFLSPMFPLIWKPAIIVLVHKNGLSTCTANYRPISLTCVTSKIMERVITGQLLSYFVENRLINEAQHGFLKGLSTTSNLLYCINDWTLSLQNRHGVTIIYIDFAKAFDTVSHEKLLYRLKCYGIGGKLLLWLRNFLKHRTHCTRVGHCVSEFCDLLSGVIQGSNVGPLLFISFYKRTG